MNITEHLQRLDTLIVENTLPPVTAILRNQLSLCIEQAEAYQASSDKQDETLAAQIKTVESEMKARAEAKAKLAEFQKQHFSKEAGARAWNERARRSNAIYNPENMHKEP